MRSLAIIFLAATSAPAYAEAPAIDHNCEIFKEYDLDRDGLIRPKEFAAYSRLETSWDVAEMHDAFTALDLNFDQILTIREFNGGVECPVSVLMYPRPGRNWRPEDFARSFLLRLR